MSGLGHSLILDSGSRQWFGIVYCLFSEVCIDTADFTVHLSSVVSVLLSVTLCWCLYNVSMSMCLLSR